MPFEAPLDGSFTEVAYRKAVAKEDIYDSTTE
jgi:hypothetical protein